MGSSGKAVLPALCMSQIHRTQSCSLQPPLLHEKGLGMDCPAECDPVQHLIYNLCIHLHTAIGNLLTRPRHYVHKIDVVWTLFYQLEGGF